MSPEKSSPIPELTDAQLRSGVFDADQDLDLLDPLAAQAQREQKKRSEAIRAVALEKVKADSATGLQREIHDLHEQIATDSDPNSALQKRIARLQMVLQEEGLDDQTKADTELALAIDMSQVGSNIAIERLMTKTRETYREQQKLVAEQKKSFNQNLAKIRATREALADMQKLQQAKEVERTRAENRLQTAQANLDLETQQYMKLKSQADSLFENEDTPLTDQHQQLIARLGTCLHRIEDAERSLERAQENYEHTNAEYEQQHSAVMQQLEEIQALQKAQTETLTQQASTLALDLLTQKPTASTAPYELSNDDIDKIKALNAQRIAAVANTSRDASNPDNQIKPLTRAEEAVRDFRSLTGRSHNRMQYPDVHVAPQGEGSSVVTPETVEEDTLGGHTESSPSQPLPDDIQQILNLTPEGGDVEPFLPADDKQKGPQPPMSDEEWKKTLDEILGTTEPAPADLPDAPEQPDSSFPDWWNALSQGQTTQEPETQSGDSNGTNEVPEAEATPTPTQTAIPEGEQSPETELARLLSQLQEVYGEQDETPEDIIRSIKRWTGQEPTADIYRQLIDMKKKRESLSLYRACKEVRYPMPEELRQLGETIINNYRLRYHGTDYQPEDLYQEIRESVIWVDGIEVTPELYQALIDHNRLNPADTFESAFEQVADNMRKPPETETPDDEDWPDGPDVPGDTPDNTPPSPPTPGNPRIARRFWNRLRRLRNREQPQASQEEQPSVNFTQEGQEITRKYKEKPEEAKAALRELYQKVLNQLKQAIPQDPNAPVSDELLEAFAKTIALPGLSYTDYNIIPGGTELRSEPRFDWFYLSNQVPLDQRIEILNKKISEIDNGPTYQSDPRNKDERRRSVVMPGDRIDRPNEPVSWGLRQARELLRKDSDLDEAIQKLEAVLAQSPNHQEAQYLLGVARQRQAKLENPTTAQDETMRTLDRNIGYARTALQSGNEAWARDLMENALRQFNGTPAELLSRAQLEADNFIAREMYKHLLTVAPASPESEEARRLLDELDSRETNNAASNDEATPSSVPGATADRVEQRSTASQALPDNAGTGLTPMQRKFAQENYAKVIDLLKQNSDSVPMVLNTLLRGLINIEARRRLLADLAHRFPDNTSVQYSQNNVEQQHQQISDILNAIRQLDAETQKAEALHELGRIFNIDPNNQEALLLEAELLEDDYHKERILNKILDIDGMSSAARQARDVQSQLAGRPRVILDEPPIMTARE
jgi:tetratricopeptide (TPR) repeat protein